MQSVTITTNVVSSNPVQARCTWMFWHFEWVQMIKLWNQWWDWIITLRLWLRPDVAVMWFWVNLWHDGCQPATDSIIHWSSGLTHCVINRSHILTHVMNWSYRLTHSGIHTASGITHCIIIMPHATFMTLWMRPDNHFTRPWVRPDDHFMKSLLTQDYPFDIMIETICCTYAIMSENDHLASLMVS
jgi:hypothetical protein